MGTCLSTGSFSDLFDACCGKRKQNNEVELERMDEKAPDARTFPRLFRGESARAGAMEHGKWGWLDRKFVGDEAMELRVSWLQDSSFAGVVRRQEPRGPVVEITVQGAVVDTPSGGLLSVWMEEVAIVEGPAHAATRKYQGRFNFRRGIVSGNWHEIREDGSLVAGGTGGFQLTCPKLEADKLAA
mmetsp:Transcript_13790/g.44133  ORF Transcript_13790/g.44133 Transcript_13790/m.44133 type:complete len:185 (-) Transcript_13790:1620-2174(-)